MRLTPILLFVAFLCFASHVTPAPAQAEEEGRVSFWLVFDNIGYNFLGNFAHNYGMNYAVGTLATYGMIESGVDWRWNRLAYNNKGLAYAGMPSGLIGFVVPVAAPLGFYYYGKTREQQIAGLAVGQAALHGFLISSGIKAFTGRHAPNILDHDGDGDKEDYSNDFKFGFFRRGAFDGWPSSHTATAFAMAAVWAELHPGNTAAAVWAYSYAAFIGAGMSLMAHWASDIVAGALIGIAVGKTVGKSFNRRHLNREEEANGISFYAAPDGMGIVWKF